MRFEDIEDVLGTDLVSHVVQVIDKAFVESRAADGTGPRALEDLLIAMLVATTMPPSEPIGGEARITDCCRRIQELAAATRSIQTSGATGKPN